MFGLDSEYIKDTLSGLGIIANVSGNHLIRMGLSSFLWSEELLVILRRARARARARAMRYWATTSEIVEPARVQYMEELVYIREDYKLHEVSGLVEYVEEGSERLETVRAGKKCPVSVQSYLRKKYLLALPFDLSKQRRGLSHLPSLCGTTSAPEPLRFQILGRKPPKSHL
ncbi:hypothetical protein Scep_010422 [Stephania cephalantha]|uniref:Uncharacterized protein n=1 Tax=Stephania cephalantha TaxID=152367 RepID=A0AAP0PH81_9MAGN